MGSIFKYLSYIFQELIKIMNTGTSKLKKYSLFAGLSVIISIMILTFTYTSVQIKKNQGMIQNLLINTSASAKQLVSQSAEILKESKLLLEQLNTISVKNKPDINKSYLSFTLLRTEPSGQNLSDNLYKMGNTPFQNDIDSSKLIKIITPELGSNLELIEALANDQFWSTQDAADLAFDQFYETNNNINLLKIVAVVMSIFLTFFIVKNQKIANSKLAYQASTDMLTLLPNRSRQLDNIQEQIARHPDSIFAVVFIDIDYFKIINDNYGHDVGDVILNKFAAKINSYLKEGDILSRFGGDEFVLLLRSIKSEKQAKKYIKKLSLALDTSFQVNNTEIFVTASIGASLYSEECKEKCSDPKILLKHADIAMYSAKQIGRNSYQFFSKDTKDRMESEHKICHALNTILKNNNADKELYLKYQPLLNIKEQDVTECEALIRWTKLNGEEVSPDNFIPLAEANNLIEKINLFVINEACLQQYKWQQNKQKQIRININLSGNKISFNKLIEQLKHNLSKYNLTPSLFGVELTERTINDISKETILQLDELRKKGLKISIDDFGTGYSSLSELKNLPVTTLKIDKVFIQGLPNDKKDHALVKTIIDLGHSLNLDIVAEGVETKEQHHFLEEHLCNVGQGYYYQSPLHSDSLTQLEMCHTA